MIERHNDINVWVNVSAELFKRLQQAEESLEEAKTVIGNLEEENRKLNIELLHVAESDVADRRLDLLHNHNTALKFEVEQLKYENERLVEQHLELLEERNQIEEVLQDDKARWFLSETDPDWKSLSTRDKVNDIVNAAWIIKEAVDRVHNMNHTLHQVIEETLAKIDKSDTVSVRGGVEPLKDTVQDLINEFIKNRDSLSKLWVLVDDTYSIHTSQELTEVVEDLVDRFHKLDAWKKEAMIIFWEQREAGKNLPPRFLGLTFAQALEKLWEENQELYSDIDKRKDLLEHLLERDMTLELVEIEVCGRQQVDKAELFERIKDLTALERVQCLEGEINTRDNWSASLEHTIELLTKQVSVYEKRIKGNEERIVEYIKDRDKVLAMLGKYRLIHRGGEMPDQLARLIAHFEQKDSYGHISIFTASVTTEEDLKERLFELTVENAEARKLRRYMIENGYAEEDGLNLYNVVTQMLEEYYED